MIKTSISNEAVLIASIVCALLPIGFFLMLSSFNFPLWGGILLNPANVAAYLWLGLTIAYYRRTRSKLGKWLFAFFPVAFAIPVLFGLFWLWGHSGP
jgi:hypothetical protein